MHDQLQCCAPGPWPIADLETAHVLDLLQRDPIGKQRPQLVKALSLVALNVLDNDTGGRGGVSRRPSTTFGGRYLMGWAIPRPPWSNYYGKALITRHPSSFGMQQAWRWPGHKMHGIATRPRLQYKGRPAHTAHEPARATCSVRRSFSILPLYSTAGSGGRGWGQHGQGVSGAGRRWHNNVIMSVSSSGGTVRTSAYLPQGRRGNRHTYPRVRWVVSALELRGYDNSSVHRPWPGMFSSVARAWRH
jgi:hypothetical protein